jgi:tetratricopeptide (TPR) repeat protein
MTADKRLFLLFLFALLAVSVAMADNLMAIGHYNQAVDLAMAGNYTQALSEVDLAIEENPNFTLAHSTRGGILNALERFPEAINASDRAIALDPGEASAWNNKAYALIHLGDASGGLVAAEKAATLDPSLTEARVNEGTALIQLGRYEEALAASEEALRLDPGSEEAKKNRDEARKHLPVPTTKAPLTVFGAIGGIALALALVFPKR